MSSRLEPKYARREVCDAVASSREIGSRSACKRAVVNGMVSGLMLNSLKIAMRNFSFRAGNIESDGLMNDLEKSWNEHAG